MFQLKIIVKKQNFSKHTRCFDCQVLGRNCIRENNNERCIVCIWRNKNCIRVKPKLYKEKIIKLTNQVKDYEERISILEKKVDRLEKNELVIKQNISYLFTILEE